MTKDEIITVAKCCIVDNCVSCPLAGHGNCITDFMNHILEYMKTEPAPAATDTSSEILKNINSTHLDDSTKEQICQAYDTADKACADILDIYEGMPACERRAFDIGEVYGKICSTRDKLENMRGAN